MGQPADKVVLVDSETEMALIGAFLAHPETMETYGSDVNPEWFGEPLAGYMFGAMMESRSSGGYASYEAALAALPAEFLGRPRAEALAAFVANAPMPMGIPGVIGVVRDRWARRKINGAGGALTLASEQFGITPFEAAEQAVALLDEVHTAATRHKAVTAGEAAEGFLEAISHPEKLTGAPTGLAVLDRKVGGWMPQQYYVIAARPGMGKSALAASCLRKTAESGAGAVLFSLEMTEFSVIARMLSDWFDHPAAPTYGDLMRGLVPPEWDSAVIEGVRYFKGLPLIIDPAPQLTGAEVSARARKYRAKLKDNGFDLAVVGVDYLGKLKAGERYKGNKVAETGESSEALRALAKDLDTCVVAFHQLSREVESRENKRPMLSDLRWSGDIEQDADVVAFLYREAYYLALDPNADPAALSAARHHIDFIIGKNRNGPTEDVRLWCDIGHSQIKDPGVN